MPTKSKTRGTKRSARSGAKGYLCLRGFSYPTSRIIRNRILGGDHMPYGERGEWTRYAEGDTIANPPSDLIKSWLRRGIVELIKSKEVSSDSPK